MDWWRRFMAWFRRSRCPTEWQEAEDPAAEESAEEPAEEPAAPMTEEQLAEEHLTRLQRSIATVKGAVSWLSFWVILSMVTRWLGC